jgi:hypothetical protein
MAASRGRRGPRARPQENVQYKSEKGTLRFPSVASIVIDPIVVTKWSPSHRGSNEYTVRYQFTFSAMDLAWTNWRR